jgi:hypothetical protein
MKVHVELLCGSSGEHLSELYTGFGMLRRAGRLDVTLRQLPDYDPGITGSPYLRAIVNRDLRIVYDLADGDWISPPELDWCSFYLKRSYNSALHAALNKVRPLGLTYGVYGRGDWRTKRLRWTLRRVRRHNLRSTGPRVVRLNRPLSWILRANGGCGSSMVEFFEAEPSVSRNPHVLFVTRTWDADRATGDKAEEWRQLNETRAGCIRALRQEFGPAFTGGLTPSASANRDYPDCLAGPNVIAKRRYLDTMRTSEICVSTRGLRGSNPWRLAEYLAASRAIVSERPCYEVPGDLAPCRNYLAFDSVDDCVKVVHRLMSDPDLRMDMMRANQDYYRNYVRPDALIARSIETALSAHA